MIYPDQKILLPDTVKAIYAVGDIHGEFMACVNDLTESCKLKDAAVIVCGDIGMGFNSYDWYKSGYISYVSGATMIIRRISGMTRTPVLRQISPM